jgi:predicted PurR-regulated permease PerM
MFEPNDRLTRALRVVLLSLGLIALATVAWMVVSKILLVVLVLIGAGFFAYLVYPAIVWLERYRWPRWLGIASVYLALALLVGGITALVGPRVVEEGRRFVHDFPGLVGQIRDAIVSANTSVLSALPEEARQTAANLFDQLVIDLQHAAGTAAGEALRIALNVVSVITGLIIVPILAFYILLDLDRLRDGTIALFPARHREHILGVLHDVDRVLGGFIRGQVIVAAVVAALATAILLAFRIKYAFLIGAFVGLMDVIPYVGAIAGAIPAMILAIFEHGVVWAALVLLAFFAMYELEGHFIAPFVVGQRVGLPPLMVIVAILIGAEIGGIAGMFVAVPVAGIIRVLWRRFSRPTIVVETGVKAAPAREPDALVVVEKSRT